VPPHRTRRATGQAGRLWVSRTAITILCAVSFRRVLRNNGLSLAMFGLFAVSFVGHGLAGWADQKEQSAWKGESPESLHEYLTSGDFIESVFENWESEFLQMSAFVILSAFLFQKGSGESKKLPEQGKEPVDEDPLLHKKPHSPGPVHRGGLLLKLYSNSLSMALVGLFVFSFAMHAVGGHAAYNKERVEEGQAEVSLVQYVGGSRFWFESFQNWQSEFLSVGALVVLSIFLRQRHSPESKPVDAPHDQTDSG